MKTRQRYTIAGPRWMNVDETAEYLGLKKSTIYQYICDRKIPFVKIPQSNQVRCDRIRIDQWMMAGEVQTLDEMLYPMGGEENGNIPKTN